VSPADVLERDGFALVRGVFDPGCVAELRRAVERNAAARRAPHWARLSPDGSPIVDSCLFDARHDPTLDAVSRSGRLPELAARLARWSEVVFVEDQWFRSAPGATTPSPWHQDGPYYCITEPFLTAWVPLDATDARSVLRLVPGSHRWAREFAPAEFAADGTRTVGSSGLPPAPDADGDPAIEVHVPGVSPGDVIWFWSGVLHAAGGCAPPDRPFRRLSIRYAPGHATFRDRGDAAASFWRLLDHGLVDGDRLAGSTFPVVHRRAT
jgi:ectoine hydroxylase-related dioxygenase (phytanoyl-CoA dioxygenase family)